MSHQEKIAFVLFRPIQAGNIGAVARALKNMGFSDLRVVEPGAPLSSLDATKMAVHGEDVLSNARVYPNLPEALADRTITVGTTCRGGPYRSATRPVREAARELNQLADTNRIGIVFGPEDHGLTNEELKLCDRIVTIPTAPEYPSLNLAQAVMIVAYEMMLAAGDQPALDQQLDLASSSKVQEMLSRMADALLAIGFLLEDNPDHIMFALRALFGRSGLTARELDILNGMARQIKWTAEGGAATLAQKRSLGKRLR